MACELLQCCRFFDDCLEGLPETAELIKSRLCRGDYQNCTRYRIFKSLGDTALPPFLNANDLEQVDKARRCLAEKQRRDSPAPPERAEPPELPEEPTT